MILITGGAYQGKTDYAVNVLDISKDTIADGRICSPNEAKNARCIKNYHELVKRLGADSISFTLELCRYNKEAVIIIDEIGCGIVPLEKSERTWRENVGRCGCIIAEHSETVIRIICGIPTAIKGELQ